MQPLNSFPPSSRPSGSNVPAFPNPHHQQAGPTMQAYGPPASRHESYVGNNPGYTAPSFVPQPNGGGSQRRMPSATVHQRASTTNHPQMNPPRSNSANQNRRSSAQGVSYTGSMRSYGEDMNLRMGNATSHGNSRPPMPMPSYSSSSIPHSGRPPGNRTASAPYLLQGPNDIAHSSTSPGHAPDDCPGCRADFEIVLRASEASALEESRLREQRLREEEQHWMAVQASEEEERRRREMEEEEELRKVMEASQRDEEAAQRRRLEKQREEEEHRQVLIEESRQSALREDEERIRRAHAELFERSRREADEVARKRRLEEERLQAIEAAALEESRREMEEEWRRRDEEERAMAEFAQQGGKQGEAAYWQHLCDDQAYDLAMQMNRTLSLNSEGGSSSRPSRKPLPPTPGLAALAAGVESRPLHNSSERAQNQAGEEWDHPDDDLIEEDSDGEDPFGDQAEALPTYDEVRTDRPPAAPETIPDHVRFAPPPQAVESSHSNTIVLPNQQPEKTAISDTSTLQAPVPINHHQPVTANAVASSSTAVPARGSLNDRDESSMPSVSTLIEPGTVLPTISEVPIPVSQSVRRSTVSSQRSFREQSLPQSNISTSPSADASTSRSSLQQRAMKGTDFGYSCEPFSTDLRLEEGEEDKKHFPAVIQLKSMKQDGLLRESQAYFVVRAHSWKMLLRALAWYGNTRVEAGVEEVVDASTSLKLRLEIEFVTPTKIEMGPGPSSSQEFIMKAHVAVCMSLIDTSLSKSSESALTTALKQSSRSLDSSYLRSGSTRRVIMLPSQAPVLPLAMVKLAQHLHQAHVFSAACPSTSHTALHSPRDLTRAIDRHDFNYTAKMKRLRKEANEAEGQNQLTNGQHDDQSGSNERDLLNDTGEVETFDEEDNTTSTMSRVKARVMRKLAKRTGENGAVDQDLESWITPFDVNG